MRLLLLTAGVVGLTLTTGAARADKEETGKVEVGKPAPNFKLPAASVERALPGKKDARELELKDLKGKNVVLFFFPKAMTRG
jgi:hypothetical protein